MIIGVDAGCLGVKDKRLKVGVYTLAKNLFEQLREVDKKNIYLLYSFYPIESKILETFGPRVKNIVVKPSKGWLDLWLPLRLLKDRPTVFLGLGQSLPRGPLIIKRPFCIGFIYDLAFEKYPSMYPDSLFRLRENTRNVINYADSLITISQSTKNDLIKLYTVPQDIITVAHPGISREIFLEKTKYPSKRPFFLFVGALKRVKNVPGILRAFAYFTKKTKFRFSLYIVGGNRWLDPEIKKTMEVIPSFVRKEIKFLGYVDDRILYRLYRGAFAFISPSFYEGFGLTFLEAMMLGCPIIASSSGSTQEVVGDAGLLVDPHDDHAIGESMITLVRDRTLRKRCIVRGIEKRKSFSNKNFVQIIYKEIQKYEKKT